MPSDLSNRQTALTKALDPASVVIDARDARDRFAFVAQFAQLILYYDQNNQQAGDWQAFFMKDPTVLLAAISACDYLRYQAAYMQIHPQHQAAVLRDEATANVDFINQCAALIHSMLVHLNRWLRFAQLNGDINPVQQFLQKSVDEVLAQQLALFIDMQQQLHLADSLYEAPALALYRTFEARWHAPQVRVSALKEAAPAERASAAKTQMERCYAAVFDIFVQVIDSAKTQFYKETNWSTPYPDIGLLMSFVTLMQHQQTMVNGYARQHLDFYYQQVLQLQPRPAQADEVYVCFTLADSVNSYRLPAGTAFLAGSDAGQTPILFAANQDFTINAARLTQAMGVYCDTAQRSGLYRQRQLTPSEVQTDQRQEVQSWPAFANAAGQGLGDKIAQGFALASPMLYLQGGLRTLTVTLALATPSTADVTALFAGARYFLSTEHAWFLVAAQSATALAGVTPMSVNMTLVLHLQKSDPPIVPFKQNPDGYASSWPLLKIVLADGADLLDPPALTSVSFAVDVRDMTQLSLANDLTPMANGVATQTFGPLPEAGSCFYVGSNEVFAKPLQEATIQLDWDSLESDFSRYYLAYNTYLLSQRSQTPSPVPFSNQVFQGQWRLLSEKLQASQHTSWRSGTVTLFQPELVASSSNSDTGTTSSRDDSAAATVNWKINAPTSRFSFNMADHIGYVAQPSLCLSALPGPMQATTGYFYFELAYPPQGFGQSLYPKVVSDVVLQNALVLMDKAKPDDRFWLWRMLDWFKKEPVADDEATTAAGSADAPARNEEAAADSPAIAHTDVLLPMPNVPYSPKQNAMLLDYKASATTDIVVPTATARSMATNAVDGAANYPFALYHYGIVQAYQVYAGGMQDTAPVSEQLGFKRLCPVTADGDGDTTPAALPLMTGVSGPGCLYLSLSGVQAPCTLSIYAEVAELDSTGDGDGETDDIAPAVTYSCWGEQGWQAMTVLQDETRSLRRSGIVQIAIPGLGAGTPSGAAPLSYLTTPLLPGSEFWLAVAAPKAASVALLSTRFSFLGAQALRLQRQKMSGLGVGETPWIAPGSITGPTTKIAQITQIRQPFASFGGKAAENDTQFDGPDSFYRRASRRLFNKDRACTVQDMIDMIDEAGSEVFHVRCLQRNGTQLRFGLVRRYANAQMAGAFQPVLNAAAIDQIAQHVQARTSSCVHLQLRNLAHQEVKISVHLLVACNNVQAALAEQINQQLRLYLSPWISTDVAAMSIGKGVNRAALTEFLSTQPGVLALTSLSILLRQADGKWQRSLLDPVLPDLPESIFISAAHHDVTLVPAMSAAPAGTVTRVSRRAGLPAVEVSHAG
jgi:hypothetical protein